MVKGKEKGKRNEAHSGPQASVRINAANLDALEIIHPPGEAALGDDTRLFNTIGGFVAAFPGVELTHVTIHVDASWTIETYKALTGSRDKRAVCVYNDCILASGAPYFVSPTTPNGGTLNLPVLVEALCP